MSVQAGVDWESHGLKFHGLSLSGIRTAMSMSSPSLSFDVAQGYPFLLTIKNFFLTHGHLDHAAGVPYIISQKAMTSQPPAKFYMPPSLVGPLDRIMKIWQEIEEHTYNYEFIPMSPDQDVKLNDKYFVRAFPALHRIEANGYTLFETHKHLARHLRDLPREELIARSHRGEAINEIEEVPLVSFTGDTKIEFLDQRPWVKHSKILFMECTYIDDRKTIQAARDWGHLHLDELIPRLDEITSEKIVLIHLSSRYSLNEAQRILAEKVPAKHLGRIEIFPGR